MVYRWRDQSARTTLLTRRSAGLFAIGVTLALLVAAAMSFGSEVALAQLLPTSEFGRATMMSNMASWVTAVLMPLALFVVIPAPRPSRAGAWRHRLVTGRRRPTCRSSWFGVVSTEE